MQDPLQTENDETGFLRGGGEMGERIRAYPWESTSMGLPQNWPLPLRTVIRIMLTTNHPVFIFWGPELYCLYNDAFSRSLGPERHPVMLGTRAEHSWAEIWNLIGSQINHVMSGAGSTWHENHLVPTTRHGSIEDVYWTYSYSPIDDPAAPAGVGGVLVLCTETTQQVHSTELLRNAQARWRQLFDQAPGFVCVLTGPNLIFEFANPMYCKLIGRSDIIGKPLDQVLSWAADQGFTALLSEVYASGQAYTAHSSPMLLPGVHDEPDNIRYLDFVYQPIRDEMGEVNGIFVLGFEVTKRVLAEDALRMSEEQLRLACESTALGIHDYDVASNTIKWNRRMDAIWGTSPGEIITYDIFEAGLHPDDRARVKAEVERAFSSESDGRYLCEYRVINRIDGSLHWVLAHGQIIFREGRAIRLVGTGQDITEARLADERRMEFLATLGHELRNPLAPIVNALALLKRNTDGNESTRQACELIDRQLGHMVRLLEDLLDVVRISKGRIEFRNEMIDLGDVVRLAMETAEPHIARGQHQVVIEGPARPVIVYADTVRLAQVFSNLLINACKYSEPGSRIEVEIELTDDWNAAVRIRDQGIGISPEYLSRLFDMFSQFEPSLHRAEGGLGIGLSVAKGLIEAQQGTLEVHSEGLLHGSVFTVRLPVMSPADNARPAARPVIDHAVPHSLQGLRILVVDDNQDAAVTLSQLLEIDGAEVATAFDGHDALALADRFSPRIVILDIGLPGMNGYELCRKLRQRGDAQTMRIVALTGWGQANDRLQSKAAGFDAHLVKPVDLEQLISTLLAPA